ncbi:MAG: hypothetical protein DMF72_19950 [Acidobacteria bacterium]|nr:MAG: hypothetical protein DMF72_19950 [Acidobacteriota bacterium]
MTKKLLLVCSAALLVLSLHAAIIANNITIHSGGQVRGANPVPEPTTLLLGGTGLAGVFVKVRQRRPKKIDTEV